jgi:DNA-binding GntR family transcriptional regulator
MQKISAAIEQRKSRAATIAMLDHWLDCEEEFHTVLIEAARNRLLSKVIREHRAITRVFDAHRHDPSLLTAEVSETTCRGRQELLTALRRRDSAFSRQIMSEQIKIGRRTVFNHMNRRRAML